MLSETFSASQESLADIFSATLLLVPVLVKKKTLYFNFAFHILHYLCLFINH